MSVEGLASPIGLAALIAPVLHTLTDVFELLRGGFSPALLYVNYAAFVAVPSELDGSAWSALSPTARRSSSTREPGLRAGVRGERLRRDVWIIDTPRSGRCQGPDRANLPWFAGAAPPFVSNWPAAPRSGSVVPLVRGVLDEEGFRPGDRRVPE
jgi:hypothetical protein